MVDFYMLDCAWWNEIEEAEGSGLLDVCARGTHEELPGFHVFQPPVPRVNAKTGLIIPSK